MINWQTQLAKKLHVSHHILFLQHVLKKSFSSANAVANVDTARKQSAQQPAFHEVVQRQY